MVGSHQLSPLIGEWAGDEQLSATAWTVAGGAHDTLSVVAGPGGGLVLDYAQEREGGTMTGHGVLFADGWWWFDSYGFAPAGPGTAAWQDGELILERLSKRGRNVTALSVVDGCVLQRIETAVPPDAPLVLLMRGVYGPQKRSG